MTAQTVSNALAQVDNSPGTLIERYKADFASVLPSHVKPETWVRLAQGVLRRNDKVRKVAERNPGSFMAALLDCARLGHEPDTPQYYLVPFGNEIVGIEGYQGEIERMYRAGAVASVKAEVVREGDHFRYNPQTMDRPEHEPDWFGDRGELKGVYAYAVMRDGSTSRVVVMNRATVMKHKAEAKGANSADSPWNKWEESMWLKTAVHELEKWVPTSAEYRREQLRAIAEADVIRNQPQVGVVRNIETGRGYSPTTGEPVDAELVDDADAAAYEQAAEEVNGWPKVAQPEGGF